MENGQKDMLVGLMLEKIDELNDTDKDIVLSKFIVSLLESNHQNIFSILKSMNYYMHANFLEGLISEDKTGRVDYKLNENSFNLSFKISQDSKIYQDEFSDIIDLNLNVENNDISFIEDDFVIDMVSDKYKERATLVLQALAYAELHEYNNLYDKVDTFKLLPLPQRSELYLNEFISYLYGNKLLDIHNMLKFFIFEFCFMLK